MSRESSTGAAVEENGREELSTRPSGPAIASCSSMRKGARRVRSSSCTSGVPTRSRKLAPVAALTAARASIDSAMPRSRYSLAANTSLAWAASAWA